MRHHVRGGGAATAALALLTLSGCLASPRSDFHAFTGGDGTIRCSSAIATVAEYADRDSNGDYPAAAVTAANKDLYCVNDDAIAPAWSKMQAQARLVYYVNSGQVATCRLGPTVTSSGSAHSAISIASDRCGSNRRYYAAGSHDAYTSGGHHAVETTLSPEITLP